MKKKIKPTNPKKEAEKGRVALWLDPEDLEFLGSQYSQLAQDTPQDIVEAWARIHSRVHATLHKAGLNQDQTPKGSAPSWNKPYEIIKSVEEFLSEFIDWQIEGMPTDDYRYFAEVTGKVEDVFKYAAILYPLFIEIEGAVVLADHYTKSNWEQWRKTHSVLGTARVVNHVHLEDYLVSDPQADAEFVRGLGKLLAFFWQMAVDVQFPERRVKVEFDGNVINISQESVI